LEEMFGTGKTEMRRIAAQGRGEADFGAGEMEMGRREARKMSWREIWEDSTGVLLILCSELFGAGMAAAARLLEMWDGGMVALQVSRPGSCSM
jgi:CO/xanthine dehydrogenase Mo-binding subunit